MNDSHDDSTSPTLETASALMAEGYYQRAEHALQTILRTNPGSLPPTIELAGCYLAVGKYSQARQLLQDTTKLGSKSAQWHTLFAQTAISLGDYEEAIAHTKQATKIQPRCCHARLLLANTLLLQGDREAAIKELQWFDKLVTAQLPTNAEDLVHAGWGFFLYSKLTAHANLTQRTRHVLNKMFQAATEQLNEKYWPAHVAAGDLLRAKYNMDEAQEEYKAALMINPHATAAHVGLGEIALDQWGFEEAHRRAELALETNPRSAESLSLVAKTQLLERRFSEAADTCSRILEDNPNQLTGLALKASALEATGLAKEADELVARASAVSPNGSTFHLTLGTTLTWRRRFASAQEHLLQAIKCDPTDSTPKIELGLLYMQWGFEDKAKQTLSEAWSLDPFNTRIDYTLQILDDLEKFSTIETPQYIIRYDVHQDEILGPYISRWLDDIFQEICQTYDVSLDRKPIIEVFPTRSDFAKRISAEPWIHTVGACSGWVVAMDSPRQGIALGTPFNFVEVLRHEFTHTVTLVGTDFNIPVWLTEGLAVTQERTRRNYLWCNILANAVRREKLFPINEIDWSFIRPKTGTERMQAYAQSEWLCEYLMEKHGESVINKLLQSYASGEKQENVFESVLNASTGQVDKNFQTWTRQQVQSWGYSLDPVESVLKLRALATVNRTDADVLARLAKAELDDGNSEEAREVIEKCLDIQPQHTRGLQLHIECLTIALSKALDNTTREVISDKINTQSTKLLQLEPDNRIALHALASVLLTREEYDEALPLLLRLHKVWPIDPFAARHLGEIYTQRHDPKRALIFLLQAAKTETNDFQLLTKIAQTYLRQGNIPEALNWFESSLQVDPFAELPHSQRAKGLMQLGRTEQAIEEYAILCKLAPDNEEYHAACALAHHKLGNKQKAQEFAAKAVALNPNSPAKIILDD